MVKQSAASSTFSPGPQRPLLEFISSSSPPLPPDEAFSDDESLSSSSDGSSSSASSSSTSSSSDEEEVEEGERLDSDDGLDSLDESTMDGAPQRYCSGTSCHSVAPYPLLTRPPSPSLSFPLSPSGTWGLWLVQQRRSGQVGILDLLLLPVCRRLHGDDNGLFSLLPQVKRATDGPTLPASGRLRHLLPAPPPLWCWSRPSRSAGRRCPS